ncbi:MAG TPA: tyrosine-type recombinase/integrase [Edaphobacter sp.]|jgi:integrase|nr:tyrosine-type recombinase/integrase [Edaphobacter sp.]
MPSNSRSPNARSSVGADSITFRHTYSTLLKANNEDVKVVEELMCHAKITTTMNIYTKALTPAKRKAQAGWSMFFWNSLGM